MGYRTLAVGVLAIASCYREAPPSSPPSAPVVQAPRRNPHAGDPLAFLPLDSELVLHLDARKVRASALWQRFEPMVRSRAGSLMTTFQNLCGFDPIATIRGIALGVKDVDASTPAGVFVVRGIDRNAVMTCYQRHEMQSRKAHQSSGASIERGVVVVPGTDGGTPVAFAFADDSTLVVMSGPTTSTQAMLDTLAAGVPLRGSDAFNALLASTDIADPLWFVINGNAKMLDTFAMFGVKPRAALGSVDFESGLAGDFRLRFDAPDEAVKLATTFQQQAQAIPQQMVSKLEITSEDADLVVGLAMTQQQVENVASLLGVGGP